MKLNNMDRMLAGLPYRPGKDGLAEIHFDCQRKIYEYNNISPDEIVRKDELLRSILGKCGIRIVIESPFHCDYGINIIAGDNFYANFNCTILDVARVIIGDNVMLAPNVSLYTAGHPIHWESRNSGYEYGREINIGNNVWIGGNTVVNPGIAIGSNVVIGSGSVVTRDIPDNMLAAGNPCRVIREITEADRNFYYKQLKFDVDDY